MIATLALEVLAFVMFAVLVAVVPYARRKQKYWTSRGVRLASTERRALAATLPRVQLDARSLTRYRDEASADVAVLGVHDAGRPCVLACNVNVAAAALGNDGFAESCAGDDDQATTLVPSTVDADSGTAVLPAMNECVDELITSLEAVANRRMTVTPWAEVKKCATAAVATCVYGQPMIDSRVKAFAQQCDRALSSSSGAAAHRRRPTDYFSTYDLSINDRASATDFRRMFRAAASSSDKIGSDVADKQVRLDMFKFVTGTIEPTAALVTAVLYELARDKNIQTRLREHLDSEIASYQKQITIDTLDRLSFLENILKETLRKYPLLPVVRRVTTKPYVVPNSGGRVTLEPGTLIMVPVHALHHDAEHFAAPEVFQPQRFPGQLSAAYMPYGSGPQSYIGKYFVGLEAKLIVAMLVSRYEVDLDSNDPGLSPDPFDPASFAGVRVQITNRQNVSEATLGESLRRFHNQENNPKKFLFF